MVLQTILTQNIGHLDANLALLLSHEAKGRILWDPGRKADYLQRASPDCMAIMNDNQQWSTAPKL